MASGVIKKVQKVKSATFSGTTTSYGQLELFRQDAQRVIVGVYLSVDGSAHSAFGFTVKSNGQWVGVLECVGETTTSQTISGTYYYVDID